MAKTYNINHLNLEDPTSPQWALAWTRLIAQDIPKDTVYPITSLEDEEWNAWLNISKVTEDGQDYFLPWEAVASQIESNPTLLESVSFGGFSQQFRNANDVVAKIRSTFQNKLEKYYPEDFFIEFDNLVSLDVGF